MTNKQTILTRAIELAVENGWLGLHDIDFEYSNIDHCWILTGFRADGTVTGESFASIKDIIFSHDFAKALWGDHYKQPLVGKSKNFNQDASEWSCEKCGDYAVDYEHDALADTCWEGHLMLMVIAEDPLAYLGANLPGGKQDV